MHPDDGRDGFFYTLHPLAKLLVTVMFAVTVMSIDKYALGTVVFMGLYLAVAFYFSGLSLAACLARVYPVLVMLGFVGIANPLLDRSVMLLGTWQVHAGWISFLSLLLKGCWAVLASYLLIATTSIEKICYALRLLHVPRLLVTQFLLTYRYLVLLLQEAENVSAAYALRAPRQKGIHFKVWGSLTGHMLLRSIERAENVYASMVMRGFQGEFYYSGLAVSWGSRDFLYLLFSCSLFLLIRFVPWMFAVKLLEGIL